MSPNCIIILPIDRYFVYKFLCNFIHQKLRSAYTKNLEKMGLQRHLMSDFLLKLIGTSLQLDNIKYKVSYFENQFSNYTSYKIFVSHTQTDRHFPEIVKSCSGHPKTCKAIKKLEVENFYRTNTVIQSCSVYIEDSKKTLPRKLPHI